MTLTDHGLRTAPAVDITTTTRPRLDTATLADIVGGLAQAEELWRPFIQHDEHERARVRLLATPAYEVWLLGWTPGQSVGLHDHGGSNGAFVVVDGVLTEAVAEGGTQSVVDRTVVTGGGGTVEAGVAHDIANRSGALATSIHAYSQPLRSMGFYEGGRSGVRGHRVRTHWVEPVPPVLGERHLGPPESPRSGSAGIAGRLR